MWFLAVWLLSGALHSTDRPQRRGAPPACSSARDDPSTRTRPGHRSVSG